MSEKKKIIVSATILIAILTVSGFAFVMSGDACSFGPGFRGHGFHHRGMPPFMHKEIGSFVLWRMDKAADKLELNKSQQQHYSALKTSLTKTLKKGLQARLQMKENTHRELEKPNPDLRVLTETVQDQIGSMAGMMDKNLSLFNTFYASLNESQQQVITQKIKDKFKNHKKYHSYDER